MTARLRRFMLTAHVIFSVGWLGAVAGFVALAVAGLMGSDSQTARGAYLAMELITWYVIVPLDIASLLTGLVSSLGTEWGLFRYYWVVIKLAITVLSTIILLLHMEPIGLLADIARETTFASAHVGHLQIQQVAASSAAVLALLVATVLSVYKPRGMTVYGWRKQHETRK